MENAGTSPPATPVTRGVIHTHAGTHAHSIPEARGPHWGERPLPPPYTHTWASGTCLPASVSYTQWHSHPVHTCRKDPSGTHTQLSSPECKPVDGASSGLAARSSQASLESRGHGGSEIAHVRTHTRTRTHTHTHTQDSAPTRMYNPTHAHTPHGRAHTPPFPPQSRNQLCSRSALTPLIPGRWQSLVPPPR